MLETILIAYVCKRSFGYLVRTQFGVCTERDIGTLGYCTLIEVTCKLHHSKLVEGEHQLTMMLIIPSQLRAFSNPRNNRIIAPMPDSGLIKYVYAALGVR